MQMNIMNKALGSRVASGKVASGKTEHSEANAVFREVASVVAGIGNSGSNEREKYAAEIEAARAAQKEAEKEKEAATTGKQFDAACDKGRRAEEKEAFFSRKLEELNFVPCLDEAVYNNCVAKVDAVVSEEVKAYQAKVSEAMRLIVDATLSLRNLGIEADKVLTDLDASANVLQSKYRYKETQFTTNDPKILATQRIEDRNEWIWHKTRYMDPTVGKLYRMVHSDLNDADAEYLRAAWHAASKMLR